MAGAIGPARLFRRDGRVALIAGGSGAIGSAIGEALAGSGASIAIAGRTAQRVQAVVEKLEHTGAPNLGLHGDVTSQADCERMVAETLNRFGRLDIVVNAVGGGAGTSLYPAEEYPEGEWDRIVDLNLKSTVLPTQAAVKAII